MEVWGLSYPDQGIEHRRAAFLDHRDFSAVQVGGGHGDVELVGYSYRTLLDGSGFDDLIAAWNRRIDSVGGLSPKIDDVLLAQLGEINRLAMERWEVVDRDPVDELLARSPNAAMIENADGQVLAINPAGRSKFALEVGDIDRGEWLAPAHVAALRQLRSAAGDKANSDRRVVECDVGKHEDGAARVLLAEARRLPLPGYPQDVTLIRSLEFEWLESTTTLVEQSWALSAAECEIARLFYRCRSLAEVARIRGVSVQTAQTQFKAVLAKSGCRGQVELVRVLTALCIQSGIDAPSYTGEWVNPYRNETRVVRPGGRVLTYSLAGPRDGRPLIWLHGPVFNHALPRAVLDRLDDLGVRLIVPCRPGYGRSEIDRARSAEDDNVDALLALADHLDLHDCPAIGTTSAASMLILARDRAPHRFGRFGLISSFGRMDEAEVRNLTPVHRSFFRLASSAPQLLGYLTALALRMVRRHGPDWYIERAYGYNARNAQALRNVETQALLRTDTQAMMLQSGGGFARDRMLVLSDPDPALLRADREDIWIYGAEDSHLAHRSRSNARVLPKCLRIEIVPEASELLVYQRPDAICDLIARL